MTGDRCTPIPTAPRRCRCGGLTLPEVLIASVILAVAAAAVTKAVATGHQVAYAALKVQRAVALGEALMEEALSLPINDPQGELGLGPGVAELNRAAYDNTGDFHGYTEDGQTLADATGTLYPRVYQGYRRAVTVEAMTVDFAGVGTVNGYQVTVTVTPIDAEQNPAGTPQILKRFVPVPENEA